MKRHPSAWIFHPGSLIQASISRKCARSVCVHRCRWASFGAECGFPCLGSPARAAEGSSSCHLLCVLQSFGGRLMVLQPLECKWRRPHITVGAFSVATSAGGRFTEACTTQEGSDRVHMHPNLPSKRCVHLVLGRTTSSWTADGGFFGGRFKCHFGRVSFWGFFCFGKMHTMV